jgi:hypothetical protein
MHTTRALSFLLTRATRSLKLERVLMKEATGKLLSTGQRTHLRLALMESTRPVTLEKEMAKLRWELSMERRLPTSPLPTKPNTTTTLLPISIDLS